MRNVVIYHYHRRCMDGFMSAFLMYLYLKNVKCETVFYPTNYGNPPPEVTGDNVYIVDFSYPPEVLLDMATRAASIRMFDHHASAFSQYQDVSKTDLIPWKNALINSSSNPKLCTMHIEFDMNRSGCSMVYRYLHNVTRDLSPEANYLHFMNNVRLSEVVAAVEDRDLWTFDLDNTREIDQLLQSLKHEFEVFETVLLKDTNQNYQARLEAARHQIVYRDQLTRHFATQGIVTQFQGELIPVLNCPENFIDETAPYLIAQYPFVLLYFITGDVIHCSLRSDKRYGKRVDIIAAKFNGGGHLHAAGFKLNPAQFQQLLTGVL